jgi:hypothetical protein
MLTADGFDDAIIGQTTKDLVVYNVSTIIEILMERDEMTEEEALEFFDYNIDGSYMGEQTPIFVFLDED